MTATSPIVIQAVADRSEGAAIAAGAGLLETVLRETAACQTSVTCRLFRSVDDIDPAEPPNILITSLLAEAERFDEPWPQAESRLRARYARLSEQPCGQIYVCTVFRHVPGDAHESARRIRIRRLNHLAAELSHETGAFVIDLDRAFADVGASTLGADYRLGGDLALKFAAAHIALTLVKTGVDEQVAFDAQEAAQTELMRRIAMSTGSTRPMAVGPATQPHKVGRHTQSVERVAMSDKQAAVYVRQALTGQIPVRDAVVRVARAVSRRGLGYSARMILVGLRQAIRRPARPGH